MDNTGAQLFKIYMLRNYKSPLQAKLSQNQFYFAQSHSDRQNYAALFYGYYFTLLVWLHFKYLSNNSFYTLVKWNQTYNWDEGVKSICTDIGSRDCFYAVQSKRTRCTPGDVNFAMSTSLLWMSAVLGAKQNNVVNLELKEKFYIHIEFEENNSEVQEENN